MASSRLDETLAGDSLAAEDDDRAAGETDDAGVLYGVAEGAAAADSVRGDGLATGLADDEAVAFVPACGDAFGCGVEAEDAAPVEPERLEVDDGRDGAAAFARFLAGAPFAATPWRDRVKVLSMLGRDFGRALCDDLLPVRLVATWPDPFSRAE